MPNQPLLVLADYRHLLTLRVLSLQRLMLFLRHTIIATDMICGACSNRFLCVGGIKADNAPDATFNPNGICGVGNIVLNPDLILS